LTLRRIKHPHHNPLYKAKTPSEPKNAQERAAIDAFDDATLAYVNRWNKTLLTAPRGVRLVDLPGADHYSFISNEEERAEGIEDFLEAPPLAKPLGRSWRNIPITLIHPQNRWAAAR
jgi:hypothetical protein